ncbi:TetR family transcriptional regulator [Propionicicella superfundia]|uniref:TetR family transcriptional regulator n=1 Tax=Propionicicella superfundia TaxID=348582 RepID=UPI000410D42C|nr:TetR family transcriptional regulator [Propionicicella superfundia]
MANSLDDVVQAAMRVLDAWGLEFFSMRRLAGELGVQPSALYHHVRDKQTLLGLMADRIVAGVRIDEDLVASCRRLRDAMLAVRDGAEVVATASAFRFDLTGLESRFAAFTSADVARTLLIYVMGHTQASQLHRQAADLGLIAPDPDLDASFERGLRIILR